MPSQKVIVRGDSYAVRRPMYKYEFLDSLLAPLDLRGYKIQITYKPVISPIETDGTDASAPLKHEIQINLAGTVTYQVGLYLVGAATAGVLEDRWSKTDTANLPLNTTLYGDVQLTDPNGEVFTWLFDETVITRDGLTHRAPYV